MQYTVLDNDEMIFSVVETWKALDSIAVDFEGEFNLHIYGEHLCLIQVYDGSGYFLIDPRSPKVTPKGLASFFSLPTEKVWFDCQSDASLVRKNYQMEISNIYDIRPLAQCLGYQGNLIGLIEQYLHVTPPVENKKQKQQANWLRRPLDPALVVYALGDVSYLFDLKKVLDAEIVQKGLSEEARHFQKKAVATREERPGWTKICDFKLLSKREKVYIKYFFIARDKIARRYNVPAARVLEKQKLVALARSVPESREALAKAIAPAPQRFVRLVEDALWESKESADAAFVAQNKVNG